MLWQKNFIYLQPFKCWNFIRKESFAPAHLEQNYSKKTKVSGKNS